MSVLWSVVGVYTGQCCMYQHWTVLRVSALVSLVVSALSSVIGVSTVKFYGCMMASTSGMGVNTG